MLTVEFHCHTNASGDCRVRVEDLLETCRQRGIDRVVVTDHNTISGALKAKSLDAQRVIVGEEILTQKGELLAAFVQEEVPAWLPPLEAIRRLRQQGAFISVSHPFDSTRSGHWAPDALLEIASLVDAIETFNARCLLPGFNHRAAAFAREHDMAGTVGSDAHTLQELGRATMRVPDFENATGLRQSMAQVQYQTQGSGLLVRLASRYAALRNKKGGVSK